MKRKIILFIDKLFNLGVEDSEQIVLDVKKETNKQIKSTRKVLLKQGDLQERVIQKTTTYYIAKSMGVVK